jgi:hypothetical protein
MRPTERVTARSVAITAAIRSSAPAIAPVWSRASAATPSIGTPASASRASLVNRFPFRAP